MDFRLFVFKIYFLKIEASRQNTIPGCIKGMGS